MKKVRINMNKWQPTRSAEIAVAPLRDSAPTQSVEAWGANRSLVAGRSPTRLIVRAGIVPAAWLNLLTTALLYVLFALVVVPVGFVRRWAGKDSLQLRAFKKSITSVWAVRDHTYRAEDLQKPF